MGIDNGDFITIVIAAIVVTRPHSIYPWFEVGDLPGVGYRG